MLCRHHQSQYNAWLDYQAPYPGWAHTDGNPTRAAQLSIDNYHAHANNRRTLIRQQLNGIKHNCKTQCQGEPT